MNSFSSSITWMPCSYCSLVGASPTAAKWPFMVITEGAVGNLEAAEGLLASWPFIWEAMVTFTRNGSTVLNAGLVTLGGKASRFEVRLVVCFPLSLEFTDNWTGPRCMWVLNPKTARKTGMISRGQEDIQLPTHLPLFLRNHHTAKCMLSQRDVYLLIYPASTRLMSSLLSELPRKLVTLSGEGGGDKVGC